MLMMIMMMMLFDVDNENFKKKTFNSGTDSKKKTGHQFNSQRIN